MYFYEHKEEEGHFLELDDPRERVLVGKITEPKTKVEIMSDNSLKTLVYQINEFLASHKVVDIHYQMADAKYYGLMYSAMIVYESEE